MSPMLWLAMAVLTVAAAAGLSRPWWSGSRHDEVRRRALNVAAYRQRLDELDAEVEAGLTGAEAAARLREELGGRLLGDAQPPEPEPAAAPRRAPRAALLLGLLLALASAGYYGYAGSWKTQQLIAETGGQAPQVEQMVAGLAARLQAEPDNVEGWAMLGRSYFVLQRYAEAAQAYARVNALTRNENPDFLVEEGESLALSRERDLAGRPQQLFDAALSRDPAHAKGLWYAGLAAAQAQDVETARARWGLLAQQPLPPELKQVLDQQLAQLGGSLAAPPAPQAAAATPGAPVLRLSLGLAAPLASQPMPEGVLFVFAKAEQGPPMPLAVWRQPLPAGAALPAQVQLDETMGMTPALKLSQFDRWVVTARLSRSGGVQAQPGDWQGSRTVTRDELGEVLPLTIDQIVP